MLAQTTITGHFYGPDGTAVTGRAIISINLPTVLNHCTTPAQTVAYRSVQVAINGGTLGSLSLLSGPCMVVQHTPTVQTGQGAGFGAVINSYTGTDLSGTVVYTTGAAPNSTSGTGTTPSTTAQVVVVFAGGPYRPGPACYIAPVVFYPSLSSAPLQLNSNTTGSTEVFYAVNTPAANTSYQFSFYCQIQPYTVKILDSTNRLLYQGQWIVPNQGSADVSVLDPK
ncbi:MAG: hypothetical protein KGL39_22120 [Patescibacteria group bacterium]|nr:hypothetical protein [Patescibacteria group bacterium]